MYDPRWSDRSLREDISMYDDATLLPPAHVIHERLSLNQRERHRLQTLLRLVRHVEEDRRHQAATAPQPEAARPEGVAVG
jgi:hypothetical protein